MKRAYFASALLIAAILTASSGAGDTLPSHLDLVTLGGFTVPANAQEMRLSNNDRQSFQGQDIFGIECRASDLPWGSFVGVSYKVGGFSGIGETGHFAEEFALHSHFIQVLAGRDIRLGTGTLGMGLGYTYVVDTFMVRPKGKSRQEHEERDSGCVFGAPISVPLYPTVAILWDYQLLLRPSIHASGSLLPGGTYTVVQGSVHHSLLVGLSFRIT